MVTWCCLFLSWCCCSDALFCLTRLAGMPALNRCPQVHHAMTSFSHRGHMQRPSVMSSRSIFPSASGFADTLMSAKHLLLRLRLLSQLKSCVGGWEDLC